MGFATARCSPQGSPLFLVHDPALNGGAIARSACFGSSELTPWPGTEARREFALCRGARQCGQTAVERASPLPCSPGTTASAAACPGAVELGETPDPYRVWLSEIMLQQTTVKAVLPRYDLFLRRWPDVQALARAELGEVLAAWAGLGYYARARNLHACAREVADRHGGRFPEDEAGLRKLPGIGDYTAAAIAAIAFGARATPVDGNIERVVARLFAVTTPLPVAKPEIRALAEMLTPDARPGDFAQAMMDLGATLCTPRRPACGLCPLRIRLSRLRRGHRRSAALSGGEGRAAGQAGRDLRGDQA